MNADKDVVIVQIPGMVFDECWRGIMSVGERNKLRINRSDGEGHILERRK